MSTIQEINAGADKQIFPELVAEVVEVRPLKEVQTQWGPKKIQWALFRDQTGESWG